MTVLIRGPKHRFVSETCLLVAVYNHDLRKESEPEIQCQGAVVMDFGKHFAGLENSLKKNDANPETGR